MSYGDTLAQRIHLKLHAAAAKDNDEEKSSVVYIRADEIVQKEVRNLARSFRVKSAMARVMRRNARSSEESFAHNAAEKAYEDAAKLTHVDPEKSP